MTGWRIRRREGLGLMGMWGAGMAAAGAGAAFAAGSDSAQDTRLQAVLARLRGGQGITVVALGGSITTGYAARVPSEGGWAAQVARWLGTLGPVRFVNAGVSGTDSAVGGHRLQAHVLDARPDLVFVEFAVNDLALDAAVRGSSFEALLRRLLLAPQAPAVLPVLLTLQGNQPREVAELQARLARQLGLQPLDIGAALAAQVQQGRLRWADLHDEPVHPNPRGHDEIARLVIAALQLAAAAAPAAPSAPAPLPAPLFGVDHLHLRAWSGEALKPWRGQGFVRGGAVHPEWAALPGGQAPGFTTTADTAEAAFLVWGRQIALFHAESEHFRNLEAWVDDGPAVTVRGQVAERRGYLGWSHTVVGRGLEPGAHLLQVRVRRDEWAGSGRPASFLAVMAAGVLPRAVREALPGDFEWRPDGSTLDPGWRRVAPDDAQLRYVGRIERGPALPPLLAWSGSELRARFTGPRLGFVLASVHWGIGHFTVEIDGRRRVLAMRAGEGPQQWQLRETLGPGEHTLRLIKRTEGSMAEARLLGVLLDARQGALLPPPPPRPLRLTCYGDSITAGACNGDIGEDQYDDLYHHDGTRAYGALAAERLGADYHGIAVSGIGLTAGFHELKMQQVWNRVAPRADAALAAPDDVAHEVVLVNLGQNDHGYPASRGERFSADFGARYLDFIRLLRGHHRHAKIVLLMGGMSAPQEQPAIPAALLAAQATLRAEGDARVFVHRFRAFAWAHPRIDVHAQLADELVTFLQTEVLP